MTRKTILGLLAALALAAIAMGVVVRYSGRLQLVKPDPTGEIDE